MITKKNFLILALLLIVIILGFVIAVDISVYVDNQDSASIFYSNMLNRVYNFSIVAGSAGLNQTNFSLPNGLTFVFKTNGTDALATMLNTSTVISWVNNTGDTIYNNLTNPGENKSFWFNLSTSVDGRYNITITTWDTLGRSNMTNVSLYVDTTPPTITFVSPLNGTSLSTGVQIINVSITDTTSALISFVSINITNLDGVQNQTLNNKTNGNYYVNSTGLNVSKYAEGTYLIRIFANDTLSNANLVNSTIYIDRTAPTLITTSALTTTNNSISFRINITEAISEITSGCLVNRTDGKGAVVMGTGSSQDVNDTDLACEKEYIYNISCNDSSGNLNTTQIYSVTTSSCVAPASSSSSSGGLATGLYTTYYPSSIQLSEGYTIGLTQNGRIKFEVGTEVHYTNLLSLNATTAKLEISSAPQQASFSIGEEKKFDVNADGYYDLDINLLSIASNKANLLIKTIHEEMPPQATEEQVGANEIAETSETVLKGIDKQVWIIVGVIIILIVVGIIIVMKKKKH